MFRNASCAQSEAEARRITRAPNALTLVYVYNDDKYGYDLVEARRVACTECGAQASEDTFFWQEEVCPGDGDFLVCGNCGEQFSQTLR